MEMNRKLFLLFLIIIFATLFLCLPGCNHQNLTKEQYEIKDKCGERSEKWSESYQQRYPQDKFSYENHYNKKLNKCFILVKYSEKPLKSLRTIGDNKIYGSFFAKQDGKIIICNVLDKKCNSEDEWDSLVNPYMDE